MGKLLVASLALCLLAAAPADAQVQECGPNQQTAWWPRAYFTSSNDPIRAADKTAIETQLKAVEELTRKTPYATPRGFAVKPSFEYHDVTSRTELQSYEFGLVVFLRCSKYDEHGADIMFTFNPRPEAWMGGDGLMRDEHGDLLYLERPRTENLFGATATFGHF